MPASIGVNLRVTGHCRQGGRKYMEDYFTVAYQQTEDEKDLEYAFFGIYDGHGGAEAAVFAKEHLMETIVRNKNFWSDDDEDVLRAIKEGYVTTHYAMWREQEKWPKTASGLPSTAGTTASVAFIRHGKIYIGHVGDSGIILGYQDPDSPEWKARALTRDHKPENPEEMSRIESCGGKVVAKSGVPRVVWNRPRIGHKGPVRRSTPIDEIPFLAVARSLGDLWSYNSALNQFVVSPDPDCSVINIDSGSHRCLIFGTDGLYNMLSAHAAVHIVQQAERHNEQAALSDHNRTWLNPSKLLVERALQRWHTTKMRADNTSVITLMLDPPGPPRAQVLKDRKRSAAAYPERGLKIVTRYEDGAQEGGCDDCLRNAVEAANESTHVTESESLCSTDENAENANTGREPAQKPPPAGCLNETVPVTSSDSASNYPLKERNFVPKPRESTSYDPREPRHSPDLNASTTDKENQSRPDDSIQIHEISSSSNDEEVCGEVESGEVKHNLRSGSRPSKADEVHTRQPVLKRKGVTEEMASPRKSVRLEDIQKNAPKWQMNDDRPKGEPKPAPSITAPAPRLSITQKILKSKKLSFKKKDALKKNLTKSKIKLVLDTVRRVQKKSAAEKKPKERKEPVVIKKAVQETKARVVSGKLSNHFQRRSQRGSLRASRRGSKVLGEVQEVCTRQQSAKAEYGPHRHSDRSANKIVVKSSKTSSSPNKKQSSSEAKKPKTSEKKGAKKKTLRRQIQQKTASLRKHVISRK